MGTLKDFLEKKEKINEEKVYFSRAFRMLEKISEENGNIVFKGLSETKLAELGAIFIRQAGLDIEKYLLEVADQLDEWSTSIEGFDRRFIEESEARNFSITSIQPGQNFTYNELKALAKEMVQYCAGMAEKDYQQVIEAGNDDEWCIGYGVVPTVIKRNFLFA